ncbi:MAG: ribonuclease J [Armatimonadota bacterium]
MTDSTENTGGFTPDPEALRFIPLGGIGEIGKNMFAYEYGGQILVVDCGMLFPEEEMLGVDLVIPDITYLLENADRVLGIVLTHGHEDHIGALPWVLNELPVPVWGTKFTLGLVRKKLAEHTYLPSVTLNEIDSNGTVALGPFTLSFFRVAHSIIDGVGLVIDSPAGRVIHTGDYKFEHSPLLGAATDLKRLAAAVAGPVLALVSDVTNAGEAGWVPSELMVAESLDILMADAEGLVVISSFASNIARMQEVLTVSDLYERKVAVMGRSMRANLEVARELGFLKVPADDLLIEPQEIGKYPRDEVTVLATGSQGEPMAALRLMSTGEQRHVKLVEGDLVVLSASPIPGNESSVYRMINQLYKQGARVVFGTEERLHVSGHAKEEEMKLMLSLTGPDIAIPVHGEYRHLVCYQALAKTLQYDKARVPILHSGDVYEMAKGRGSVIGRVTAGRVMIDGLGVGDIGAAVLRDRKHLSEDGMLVAIVAIDAETGEILSGPDLVTRGFVYLEHAEALIEEAKDVVRATITSMTPAGSTDLESVKTSIRSALSRFITEQTRRRPLILPVILEI